MQHVLHFPPLPIKESFFFSFQQRLSNISLPILLIVFHSCILRMWLNLFTHQTRKHTSIITYWSPVREYLGGGVHIIQTTGCDNALSPFSLFSFGFKLTCEHLEALNLIRASSLFFFFLPAPHAAALLQKWLAGWIDHTSPTCSIREKRGPMNN